jgi:hypothetical protein
MMRTNFALLRHTAPPSFKGRPLTGMSNKFLELLTFQAADFQNGKCITIVSHLILLHLSCLWVRMEKQLTLYIGCHKEWLRPK